MFYKRLFKLNEILTVWIMGEKSQILSNAFSSDESEYWKPLL